MLVVGGSYSAEDIALQTIEAGAERVTICYRTQPVGNTWPQGIDQRAILTHIHGSTVQ